MNTGSTVFAQLMDFLPLHEFRKCTTRYQGNYKVRSFSCFDQFLCMAFAQLTYRESLRDIETCLRVMQPKLFHMGIRSPVSRSTLADANERRDWQIYADFAQILIAEARKLYTKADFGVDLDATVYALDSTTIDLCLSMFPWARFRTTKSAVKLHTLLNLRGSIPEFILISDGKLHDVNVLDYLLPAPGAYYIMDRGYLDFKRLYEIHTGKAFFVTRAKGNQAFARRYSRPVDKTTGILCDQTVVLTSFYPLKDYPEPLRRIKFHDPQENSRLVFLTNDFSLSALTITQLYKARWRIELFFKWIKQHLRIKAFYGTSPNAVKTQIWIAIAVYVLVAIVKKRLELNLTLYTILQFLSVSLFEKIPILQAFADSDYTKNVLQSNQQLNLFNL